MPLAVPRRLAPWWACALVAGWAVLMAAVHPGQFSDSIEQYNWAHSLEWGYWKHPPLPTWMMRGAIALIGAHHWTAPLLAACCLAACAWFIWDLARMLLGERAANLAVVLWPLQHALMLRADVFNHNTALLLFAAATAWTAVRAWRSGHMRDWVITGIAAGLGLLTKYQEIVTIVGVIVALAGCGALRDARTARGVAVATLVAFVIFLPHALWALDHQLTTLRYIENSSPVLEPVARVPAVLRFFGVLLSMIVSMLLAAAAARFWPAREAAAAPRHEADVATASWMFGLVVVPLFVVVVTVLLGGHKPQKMWALHTTLFLPLWLAWAISRARPAGALALHAGIAATVLVAANATYAVIEAGNTSRAFHAPDRFMPADKLAQAALADWHAATRCPLKFVRGGAFAAGLVSVYSGVYPTVLEDDFEKSPWVRPDEIEARGSIELHGPDRAAEVPEDARRMEVPAPEKFGGPAFIWWRVIPPLRPGTCAS